MPPPSYEQDRQKALQDLSAATTAGTAASAFRSGALQSRTSYETKLNSYTLIRDALYLWLAQHGQSIPLADEQTIEAREASAGAAAISAAASLAQGNTLYDQGAVLVSMALAKFNQALYVACSADAVTAKFKYEASGPLFQSAAYDYSLAYGDISVAYDIVYGYYAANDIVISPSP